MDSPDPELPTQHPAQVSGRRFNPWLFFGVLLLPGALSLATLAKKSNDYGMTALTVLLAGSVIAGLMAGIHFTRLQTRLSTGAKIALGVVAVIGCAGVSIAFAFGGCLLGSWVGIIK